MLGVVGAGAVLVSRLVVDEVVEVDVGLADEVDEDLVGLAEELDSDPDCLFTIS